MGHLAPDAGRETRDLGGRPDTVQPGHQQVAESRRHHGSDGLAGTVRLGREVEKHRGELLDVEGYAVGARDNLADEPVALDVAAGDLLHHGADGRLVQPAEREGHVGLGGPVRGGAAAPREDREHPVTGRGRE